MVVSTLLQLAGVSKSYGGVRALDDIDWSMEAGEVHALCGENGAGKSTLIKILGGVVRPDEGAVTFLGRGLEGGDVAAAERAGIAVIHQESTAFPDLNAVDNIFVGRESGSWGGGNLDFTTMRRRAEVLLSRLGETLDLACPLRQLPLAQRQMVAMARALACDCRLLIMDEPTASLSARETEALFALIRRLRQEGVGILYVSHRLEEIFTLADRITVLRDGRWIDTKPASGWTRESLIQSMVGRAVQETIGVEGTSADDSRKPELRVRGLTRGGRFEQVNFELRAGEVLGLGGLVGAGRSEVARCLFGIDRYDAGEVWVQEQRLPRGDVEASIAAGLALVPEDRQSEGLVLPFSIRHNVSLAVLRRLCRRLRIVFSREKQVVEEQLVDLGVKHAGMEAAASTLSGGNQQKLVLGKWLATQPRILILDEPTRGVDVGAKAQFHQLIRQLASRGLAVLLISSDLPELLALSDRILVMREGRVVGEMGRGEATQGRVLEMALPDGPAPDGQACAGESADA